MYLAAAELAAADGADLLVYPEGYGVSGTGGLLTLAGASSLSGQLTLGGDADLNGDVSFGAGGALTDGGNQIDLSANLDGTNGQLNTGKPGWAQPQLAAVAKRSEGSRLAWLNSTSTGG